MSTIYAQQHKPYPSHQLFSPKKHFKDLEIPPRKLLLSKKTLQENLDMSPYESNLPKFLPFNDSNNSDPNTNNTYDDDLLDLDPYSSDHFRMYEFKIRRCTRSRSHDWTDCPFAHPGEKARRRDPRKYHYSGAVCPEYRRGGCSRGDACEFAHGVFECWLHPSRYRTEACKDGKNCNRKVCFFAHSPRQLRILPEISCGSAKFDKSLTSPCSSLDLAHCCCLACHSVISSPTSTLLGMSHMSPPLSPSLSPPLSPVKHRGFSPISPVSRFNDRLSKLRSGCTGYKDVLTELMTSLDAINFNNETAISVSSPPSISSPISTNTPWIEASFNCGEDHQQQFILSPTTPNYPSGLSRNSFNNRDSSRNGLINNNSNNYNGGGQMGGSDPDLGWVNELLM